MTWIGAFAFTACSGCGTHIHLRCCARTRTRRISPARLLCTRARARARTHHARTVRTRCNCAPYNLQLSVIHIPLQVLWMLLLSVYPVLWRAGGHRTTTTKHLPSVRSVTFPLRPNYFFFSPTSRRVSYAAVARVPSATIPHPLSLRLGVNLAGQSRVCISSRTTPPALQLCMVTGMPHFIYLHYYHMPLLLF